MHWDDAGFCFVLTIDSVCLSLNRQAPRFKQYGDHEVHHETKRTATTLLFGGNLICLLHVDLGVCIDVASAIDLPWGRCRKGKGCQGLIELNCVKFVTMYLTGTYC